MVSNSGDGPKGDSMGLQKKRTTKVVWSATSTDERSTTKWKYFYILIKYSSLL